jgi:molecular chaperone GrpE
MEDSKAKKHGSGNGDEISEEMLRARKKSVKPAAKIEQDYETEIKDLKDEIELLRKELSHYKKTEEEYLDRLKRLHADYDNYRKRMIKEQADTISRANKDLIEKMLPVIDSFESALAMGNGLSAGNEDFLKGVRLIYSKLMETLQKEGVSVIDPKGKEFNPEECEAAVTEDVKGIPEGTILEVLRKGYRLNDFLVRPAVVKVCKKH